MKRIITAISIPVYLSSCSNDKLSETKVPENLILDRYTTVFYNDKGKLEYEKDYSSKDSLESITTTFYNENFQIVKVVDWQPENGVIGLYIYTYDNTGKKTSQRVYDKSGNLSSKWKYFYNSKNNLVTNICFDGKNQIRNKIEICFDSIKNIPYTINSNSNNISFDSTIWLDKNTCKEISFKENKSILKYKEIYDDKKRVLERIQYNETGQADETIKWDNYIGEDAQFCTFINAENQIDTYAVDKYNEGGQKIRTEWYKLKTTK